MGLDVIFKKELRHHARAAKVTHDAAMALALELVGDDLHKVELLNAYSRGFYAALVSTQAAIGSQPVLSGRVSVSIREQTRPLLPASEAVNLSHVIVDFVEREE